MSFKIETVRKSKIAGSVVGGFGPQDPAIEACSGPRGRKLSKEPDKGRSDWWFPLPPPFCNALILSLWFFSLSLVSGSSAFANSTKSTVDPDYRSLSLGNCLALAKQYNPALDGAKEKIRQLTEEYRAARSRFFPQLALSSYYERLEPDRLPPGGASAPPSADFNSDEAFAGITVRQLLFNGGQTYYSAKSAKIGALTQRQEAVSTGNRVAFDVTQAFYRLIAAKENCKVTRDALSQRQAFLSLTEAFFKAGKITRLDLFRARSQVSDAHQTQTAAGNALRLAREILARTIGLKARTEVDIRGQLPESLSPPPGIDTLWSEALMHNPEIKGLNLQIRQSESLVKAAKGAYFPEINLQGDIGTRHQDSAGTRGEWSLGIFVNYPLFDGGLRRAQVAAANSRHRQAMAEKRDRLNSLKIDLETAWKDLENSRAGVIDIQQTVATNKEAYNSALALYRNGKAIGLDVLQAQVDLTGSRFSLIQSKTDYEIARARIRQVVGTPVFETAEQNESKGQKN